MIDSSIEELFDSINNSKEYKEYNEIMSILKDNQEVSDLIEEIKTLQKKATNLEYNNDDRYKELDKEISRKSELLNNNKDYQEYLSKLKKFNSVLISSSTLIEDYIDEKVSI
ncbi:MAG: YlbF family regulator [Bacilli bacterium]|nr:YlbF family regulator [Bacilli bacterium]